MSESVIETGLSDQNFRGGHTQFPAAGKMTSYIPGLSGAVRDAAADSESRKGQQTHTSAETRRRRETTGDDTGQPSGETGTDSQPSGSPGAATPLEVLPAALVAAARDQINLRTSERLGLWSTFLHMSRGEQDRTGDQRARDPEHHRPQPELVHAGLHSAARGRPEDVHVPGREPGVVRAALDQASYPDMERFLRSEQRQGPWLAAMRDALQESSPHPDTPPEQLWTRLPNTDDATQHYSTVELGMLFMSAATSTDPRAVAELGRVEHALLERHPQFAEVYMMNLASDPAFLGDFDSSGLNRLAAFTGAMHQLDNRPITEQQEFLHRVVDRFDRRGASIHQQVGSAKILAMAIEAEVPGADRTFEKAEQTWLRNNPAYRDTHAEHLQYFEAQRAAGNTKVHLRVDALISTLEDARGTPKLGQTSYTEAIRQTNDQGQLQRSLAMLGYEPGEAADPRFAVGGRTHKRLGENDRALDTNGRAVQGGAQKQEAARTDRQAQREGTERTHDFRKKARATKLGAAMDAREMSRQAPRLGNVLRHHATRLTAKLRHAVTRGRQQVQQSRHIQASARATATTTTRASVRT